MRAATFLRRQTAELHRQTEELAFGRETLEYRLSLDQYRCLIDRNLFLHTYLEPLLEASLGAFQLTAFFPNFHPRLADLQADAALLELQPTDFTISPPQLSNAPEVLGSLYVVLGSALGSRVIYPALKANPALEHLEAFHFFSFGSRYPSQEWPRFCRLLDEYLLSERDLEQAGDGAAATFRFFHKVYAQTGDLSNFEI